MKKYDLGSIDPRQYSGITDEEREAWLHPEPHSYHSFHVERMGEDVFRWRDSREGRFVIGSFTELCNALAELRLRKIDPNYQQHITAIRVLSQTEIDDLFADL